MRFNKSVQFCFLSTTILLSGCREPSDTVSVTGKVTYRGQPLTNGAVMFFPPTGRPSAVALSEDGSYSADLPPGEYTVTINVVTELPPGYREGDPLPPPKIVLPPEYTTQAKSTLKATVSEENQQPIDFKLD
jgi:hypothetical protein